MGSELFHVRVDVLGVEDGLVLVGGEQHVVQQVDVRAAAEGAVKGVVGVVHGEVKVGLIASKPFIMSVVTEIEFLLSLFHFTKSEMIKRNCRIKI